MCSNEYFYRMDCPSGLEWNANKNQCDYPQHTTCTLAFDKEVGQTRPEVTNKLPLLVPTMCDGE